MIMLKTNNNLSALVYIGRQKQKNTQSDSQHAIRKIFNVKFMTVQSVAGPYGPATLSHPTKHLRSSIDKAPGFPGAER